MRLAWGRPFLSSLNFYPVASSQTPQLGAQIPELGRVDSRLWNAGSKGWEPQMLSVNSPWQRTRHFQHSHPERRPSTHPIQANSSSPAQGRIMVAQSHVLHSPPLGADAGGSPRPLCCSYHLPSSKAPVLSQNQHLCTLFVLSKTSSACSVSR